MSTILEAAERVLSTDPTASISTIASAAGVSRTTVHRRFASRDALLQAMALWAAMRFEEAVTAARTEVVPALVGLHQVTANVLQVKVDWRFALEDLPSSDPEVERLHAGVAARCDRLFERARDEGVVADDVDLDWARRVYYALVQEAARSADPAEDTDVLAAQVVDTLLWGLGGHPGGRRRAAT